MVYRFICPKCGKTAELSIPVSEYTPGGYRCECGETLVRDPKDFCTTWAAKCDGFYSDHPAG